MFKIQPGKCNIFNPIRCICVTFQTNQMYVYAQSDVRFCGQRTAKTPLDVLFASLRSRDRLRRSSASASYPSRNAMTPKCSIGDGICLRPPPAPSHHRVRVGDAATVKVRASSASRSSMDATMEERLGLPSSEQKLRRPFDLGLLSEL
jgi:hypothetical protein